MFRFIINHTVIYHISQQSIKKLHKHILIYHTSPKFILRSFQHIFYTFKSIVSCSLPGCPVCQEPWAPWRCWSWRGWAGSSDCWSSRSSRSWNWWSKEWLEADFGSRQLWEIHFCFRWSYIIQALYKKKERPLISSLWFLRWMWFLNKFTLMWDLWNHFFCGLKHTWDIVAKCRYTVRLCFLFNEARVWGSSHSAGFCSENWGFHWPASPLLGCGPFWRMYVPTGRGHQESRWMTWQRRKIPWFCLARKTLKDWYLVTKDFPVGIAVWIIQNDHRRLFSVAMYGSKCRSYHTHVELKRALFNCWSFSPIIEAVIWSLRLLCFRDFQSFRVLCLKRISQCAGHPSQKLKVEAGIISHIFLPG